MSTPLQSSWARPLALALGVAISLLACRVRAQPPLPREVGRIELPGVSGRIDHLAIDSEGRRVYIAALGADKVEVVDLKSGLRVAELAGVREPQGIVFLPRTQRLFVAGGESDDVTAFESGRRIGTVGGLPDADNLRWLASTGQLFAGYGSGLVAIDPNSIAIVQRIALLGHPEAFELAERGPEIYVNVPSAGLIVVVDRHTGKTIAEWRIAPDAANFPMALDEAAHRLYVGTRRPAKLLVYDTGTGRRLSEAPLCGDVDDLFLDTKGEQVLAVCGEGEVDAIATRRGLDGKALIRLPTRPGARTGGFEPASRTLFVAVPARLGHKAELRLYRLP